MVFLLRNGSAASFGRFRQGVPLDFTMAADEMQAMLFNASETSENDCKKTLIVLFFNKTR